MVSTWVLLTRVTYPSVFPFALTMAIPATIIATVLKIMHQKFGEEEEFWNMTFAVGGSAWAGFTSLVVFLLTFRVGQAFTRFSSALTVTHQMQGAWSRAASSTAAFCKRDDKTGETDMFLHKVVRLFSILGACALQELSDVAQHHILGLETLNSGVFDDETLLALDSETQRVDLVYSWMQQLIADGTRSGVLDVPAPFAGRILGELSSGLGKYEDAMRHAKIEFPFRYAQTSLWLLIIHWLLTPFVMVQQTEWISGASLFTFVLVFFLWALKDVCVKFEAPFGGDIKYLEPQQMQRDFNKSLCLILSPASRRGAKLDTFAQVTYASLQTRGTLHQAALEREGWQLSNITMDKEDNTTCSCCGGKQGMQTGARPKIAVSERYCTKHYGIIDGQKTAAYGVGIYDDHLVLALPCPYLEDEKEKLKLEMDVCEVVDLDRRPCLVRITKVPVAQRHSLLAEPDPDWAMEEYTNFPAGQRFHSKELARAYVNQLQKKTLAHACTKKLSTEEDQRIENEAATQVAMGLADMLHSTSTIKLSGIQAVANTTHDSIEGPSLERSKRGEDHVDPAVSVEHAELTEVATTKPSRLPKSAAREEVQEKVSGSSAFLSASPVHEVDTKSNGVSRSRKREADTKPSGQAAAVSKIIVLLDEETPSAPHVSASRRMDFKSLAH